MSTTQTITTAAEIPKILESFYTKDNTGLIPRGVAEIYQQTAERPSGLTGAAAYTEMYKPLIEKGLMGAQGIAGLSPFQQYVGNQLSGMQLPGQYGLATEAGQQSAAGLQALQNAQALGVSAPDLTTFQTGAPSAVSAPLLSNYTMAAPSSVAADALTKYQLGNVPLAERQTLSYTPSQFTADVAQQYMSPYMQAVVDRQQQAAIKAAKEGQLGQNLAAARQGSYGGARQALLQGQRESGLQSILADIQAKGLQSAFESAQQQFERDRVAQMSAASQNLQSGLQTELANQAAKQAYGQANLQAALGVQQLGSGQSLQAQLANQAAQQQAAQANLQAALGVQQLGAGQSLQAQLANQAAQQQADQANLQAALGVQQLGAGQSLQAQLANQGAQQQALQTRLGAAQGLGALAGTLGQLGTQQLAGQLDLTKTQGAFGDLQRAVQQQQLDAERQFLTEQAQYGQTQVGQLSNLLRGIPLQSATQTATAPPPSFASQLTGLGLTGIGLYNMLGGGKS
jgi:hypothetical protein